MKQRHFATLVIFAAMVAAALAVAFAGGGRAATPTAAAKTCPLHYTRAIIGGAVKCLHAGEFCAARYAAAYRQYGYACVNGRLQRISSAPSPPPPPPRDRLGPAVTLRARAAGVSAALTYRRGTVYGHLRLAIRDSSGKYATRLVRPSGCDAIPVRLHKMRPLTVRDFNADGQPEVVVTFSCGGAHGRGYSFFFTRSGSRYVRVTIWWQEFYPTVRDVDGDGVPEFVTADARFSYLFTSFAESGNPIRIWDFMGTGFSNVTTSFQTLVEKDRALWWRWYRKARGRGDVRGYLSAYLADMYLLGQEDLGWQQMHTALARGDLGRRYAWEGPSGQAYLDKLRRFLASTGYAA